MSTVTVLTYASPEYKALEALTLPNKIALCELHNYRLAHPLPGTPFDCAWDRITFLYHILETGAPFVAWLDCDWICTNLSVDLRKRSIYDFAMGRDYAGPNTGVLLARNTDATKIYLTAVLSDGPKRFGSEYGSEQDALAYYARLEDHAPFVEIAPQRRFNSYRYRDSVRHIPAVPAWGEWQPGDYGLHLAGVPMEDEVDPIDGQTYPGKLTIAREVLRAQEPTPV